MHKGFTGGDEKLLASIPQALAATERVCASVNVASTRAGINMDAVYRMGKIVKETAELTPDHDGLGCQIGRCQCLRTISLWSVLFTAW